MGDCRCDRPTIPERDPLCRSTSHGRFGHQCARPGPPPALVQRPQTGSQSVELRHRIFNYGPTTEAICLPQCLPACSSSRSTPDSAYSSANPSASGIPPTAPHRPSSSLAARIHPAQAAEPTQTIESLLISELPVAGRPSPWPTVASLCEGLGRVEEPAFAHGSAGLRWENRRATGGDSHLSDRCPDRRS